MSRRTRATALLALGLAAVAALSACSNGRAPGEAVSDGVLEIGLLLPDSVTSRYQSADRPYFEAAVAKLEPGAVVRYANADGDAAKQLQQAESMLTEGIDVLVLSPFDSSAAATIVSQAASKGVPVVSYDRLISSPDIDYYVSFDNVEVGRLQAKALVDRMSELEEDAPADSGVLVVNGSPTDNNAGEYKRGVHSVLDDSDVPILAEYDVPGWDPSQAQNWVAGQITSFGDRISGIYVANDSMAAGAIAALKSAGVSPLPPVTGQDAELAGIQRILSGDQYVTVYKGFRQEAEIAAGVAVGLSRGQEPEGQTEVDGIPATLLTPLAVTADLISSTVVADGFYTAAQICTPEYLAACERNGVR